MNERTFLPVFMPLAPAATVAPPFPDELRRVLNAHGVDPRFVESEIAAMGVGCFAKIASPSVLGVMNEFADLGDAHRQYHGPDDDLIALSLRIAETPTSPLYQRHISPDHELRAVVDEAMCERDPGSDRLGAVSPGAFGTTVACKQRPGGGDGCEDAGADR